MQLKSSRVTINHKMHEQVHTIFILLYAPRGGGGDTPLHGQYSLYVWPQRYGFLAVLV